MLCFHVPGGATHVLAGGFRGQAGRDVDQGAEHLCWMGHVSFRGHHDNVLLF